MLGRDRYVMDGGVAVVTGAVFLGIKAKKKRERALEEE